MREDEGFICQVPEHTGGGEAILTALKPMTTNTIGKPANIQGDHDALQKQTQSSNTPILSEGPSIWT